MSLHNERQWAANKANAQHSTGPRTAEGKAKVSKNAHRYGIRPEELYTDDDAEEYQHLGHSLYQEFEPATATEVLAVTNLISYAWRLRRIRRIEADRFEENLLKNKESFIKSPGPESSRAFFRNDGKEFALIQRYEAAMQRGYNNALKQLKELIKEREQKNEKQTHSSPPGHAAQTKPRSWRAGSRFHSEGVQGGNAAKHD